MASTCGSSTASRRKGEHAVEALEGLVDQHVAALQPLEERLGRRQRDGIRRRVRRKTQLRLVDQVDQLREPRQVHRPVHAVQRLRRQVELRQQEARERFGTAGRHLQAHGLAVVAVLQALAQSGAQVLHVFLVDRKVGMARDAELREVAHLAAREHARQMRPHHARQRHEQRLAVRHLGRHADQARQHARQLDDLDRVLAPEGVLAAQTHDEVERLVGHLRERVRRVEPDRNQQRAHFALEILADPLALRRVALAVRNDVDAVLCKRRHQLVVVERVLARHQRVGRLGQPLERIDGVGALLVAGAARDQVRCRAHFEELVEVRRHDAQVAQALDQRHRRAMGPVEHPLIERQDAVVAVQQRERGRRGTERRICGDGWHGH
jgi:hypothetical protein